MLPLGPMSGNHLRFKLLFKLKNYIIHILCSYIPLSSITTPQHCLASNSIEVSANKMDISLDQNPTGTNGIIKK